MLIDAAKVKSATITKYTLTAAGRKAASRPVPRAVQEIVDRLTAEEKGKCKKVLVQKVKTSPHQVAEPDGTIALLSEKKYTEENISAVQKNNQEEKKEEDNQPRPGSFGVKDYQEP